MKITPLLFLAAGLAQTHAFPSQGGAPHPLPWSPPGPNDVRAPCPMLNTLANHGYLPHNGKDITEQHTINALYNALGIDAELATYLHQEAVTTNPAPNATTFSLNDLSRHDILEHDASLSRQDAFFGDNHDFNQTIFDETRSYWTSPIIDVKQAALSRQARVNTSMATNPNYTMSELGASFSYGETAAYIIVLGDKENGLVNRSRVEYLFENERLPLDLGWTRAKENITFDDLSTMLNRIVNATGGESEFDRELAKRGGVHVGKWRE
ncbi:peroxidase [Aspergillus piperis CBS 112811]|uniref:Peroxidase n=1 Tax=Aspergillus piperis CBS 112811 TaxID=1448313 RepID=A0A8G1QYJ6_9EURO|nr:peroxidase [Aspergillus piperis CBS 112811]RAH55983.1 peroxidase [Aspergillus piperis CBS 112811]